MTTSIDYFTPHDFHSSEEIRSCISENSFSALHFNIRSLAANFTSFCQLLDSLGHSFPIIGLSKTKILQNKDPILNTSLPGYAFLSQPTLSEAGGVEMFVKENQSFLLDAMIFVALNRISNHSG